MVFKAYQPNQPTFLPPSLDELLSPHHLVRVVSVAIDRMDISPLVAAYPGGGASSYHPKMMLKVLVYAYMQRIYSSRQIVQGDYRSDNGCRTSRRVYQVDDCSGCPVMESCLPKGTKRRRVAIGDAL